MRKIFKWVGVAVAVVGLFAVVVGFTLYSKGSAAASRTYAATNPIESVPNDSTLIRRGEHLSHILACRACHGDDLSGEVLVDAPPFLAVAANVTPAIPYSAAELDKAIRFGIKRDGTAILPLMPAGTYADLGHDDATALIAYLLSIEPISASLPESELRPLGKLLVGAGGINPAAEVTETASAQDRPAIAASAEYGEYLASIVCVACHGADMKGSPSHDPSAPANPDISMAGDWPLELFESGTRRGIGTNGQELHEMMPSKHFSHMTDLEIEALHAYFKTL